jgi:hypothetical protein
MAKTITIVFLALLSAVIQLGCGKKPLDRDTALRLLQDRNVQSIQMVYEGQPFPPSTHQSAYQQLVSAGVLRAEPLVFGQVKYQAGPNNFGGLVSQEHTEIIAGYLRPTAVTGIRQTGSDEAVAEVTLSFVPSPVYSQFQAAMDEVASDTFKEIFQRQKQPRETKATFRRYDNGWRLENFTGLE